MGKKNLKSTDSDFQTILVLAEQKPTGKLKEQEQIFVPRSLVSDLPGLDFRFHEFHTGATHCRVSAAIGTASQETCPDCRNRPFVLSERIKGFKCLVLEMILSKKAILYLKTVISTGLLIAFRITPAFK